MTRSGARRISAAPASTSAKLGAPQLGSSSYSAQRSSRRLPVYGNCYTEFEAGNIRATIPLPSAETDRSGKVYLAWPDCRFESGCFEIAGPPSGSTLDLPTYAASVPLGDTTTVAASAAGRVATSPSRGNGIPKTF